LAKQKIKQKTKTKNITKQKTKKKNYLMISAMTSPTFDPEKDFLRIKVVT
jgi:hypothetical protein